MTAAFTGGAAVAAVMIGVAQLSGREWLIPVGLCLAAVITVVCVRRQQVVLRDEEP